MTVTYIDAKIYDALKLRISTMPGGFTIVYPGDIYPTSADVAFIVVTDARFGNERLYNDTAASDNHTGQFMLDAMVPLSWTHSQLLGIAGVVVNWFTKDLRLSGLVRIEQTPAVTTSYRDGGFNRLPIAVSWRAVG